MTDLPRKAAARTARLAALPLGYAGRTAIGLGKRIGGAPAETVHDRDPAAHRRAALPHPGRAQGRRDEVRPGAQSVLEAALPEEVAAPYREQLTRLQDSAPPMPTQTVRDQLAADLGADWRDQLVWLDGGPTAAASIGQVHRGRWHDGREVAVKVQYPGAGEALMSDLRQLARRRAHGWRPVLPRHRHQAAGRGAAGPRRATSSTTSSRPRPSATFAEAFRDDPGVVVPDVVDVGEHVLVTEWLESPHSLARVIREGTPGGARPLRPAVRPVPVRRARRAPGCCTPTRTPATTGSCPPTTASPGRLGVLDFGAVARLPERGLPEAMGRLIRIAARRGPRRAGRRAARGGVHQGPDPGRPRARCSTTSRRSSSPPRSTRSGSPGSGCASSSSASTTPGSPTYTVAIKLNLPPSYLLIHRTWLGGLGVLSQLEAEAPFRAILEEYLPGFASA